MKNYIESHSNDIAKKFCSIDLAALEKTETGGD